ncbi:MAG: prolipoprotein diacylglyceryl transferase, partial [Planctomycetes bacterium]|nr:prolipoprotein diacylglyceryl transferase [Planctomycetota bacterium]
MHPIFLDFGAFKLPTYGAVLLVACVVGGFVATRLAKRAGIDPRTMFDLCLIMGIGAYLGTRVFFLATEWDAFREHPIELLTANKGVVFYGAVLGAIPPMAWGAIRWKLPVWTLLDCFAPALALLHSIGRIGCYLGGCCYGKPCPNGVIFPALGDETPRYPTQLYESGFEAFNFALLLYLWFVRRRPGQVWWTYLVLYGTGRFWLESLRGDDRGPEFLGGYSISQMLSAPFVVIGLIALLWPRRRKPSPPPSASSMAIAAGVLAWLLTGCHNARVPERTPVPAEAPLLVSSDPPGAAIFVDDAPQFVRTASGRPRLDRGVPQPLRTPATIRLPETTAGRHAIGIRWPDRTEARAEVHSRRTKQTPEPVRFDGVYEDEISAATRFAFRPLEAAFYLFGLKHRPSRWG